MGAVSGLGLRADMQKMEMPTVEGGVVLRGVFYLCVCVWGGNC